MPHLIIEHSSHCFIEKDHNKILSALYQQIIKTGLFNENNIKVRLHKTDNYLLSEQYRGFIHVQCRIHEGRCLNDKKRISREVTTEIEKYCKTNIVITCEVVEMATESYAKMVSS